MKFQKRRTPNPVFSFVNEIPPGLNYSASREYRKGEQVLVRPEGVTDGSGAGIYAEVLRDLNNELMVVTLHDYFSLPEGKMLLERGQQLNVAKDEIFAVSRVAVSPSRK